MSTSEDHPKARYLVPGPVWIREFGSRAPAYYAYEARFNHPVAIELDARTIPSRAWKPINEAAQKALAAIGVEAALVKERKRR